MADRFNNSTGNFNSEFNSGFNALDDPNSERLKRLMLQRQTAGNDPTAPYMPQITPEDAPERNLPNLERVFSSMNKNFGGMQKKMPWGLRNDTPVGETPIDPTRLPLPPESAPMIPPGMEGAPIDAPIATRLPAMRAAQQSQAAAMGQRMAADPAVTPTAEMPVDPTTGTNGYIDSQTAEQNARVGNLSGSNATPSRNGWGGAKPIITENADPAAGFGKNGDWGGTKPVTNAGPDFGNGAGNDADVRNNMRFNIKQRINPFTRSTESEDSNTPKIGKF